MTRTSSDTRQRILDSALHLFAEHGYAGTAIRDIAEELGVTKAAVHYHFPSKEQIVAALLEPFMARFRAVVEGAEHDRPADPRALLLAVRDVLDEASPLLGLVTSDPSIAGACGDLQRDAKAMGDRMARSLVEPGAPRGRVLQAHVCLGGFVTAYDAAMVAGGPLSDEEHEALVAACLRALSA